jgi:8-oxo-dGTP diphosphatase
MNKKVSILYDGENINLPSTFYRVSAKTIIYNETRKFLVLKDNRGYYSLPWWWVEYGEIFEEALEREVKEETWFTIDIIKKTPFCIFSWISLSKIPHVFVVYTSSLKSWEFTPSDEAIDIMWIDKEMLDKIPLNPSLQGLVKFKDIL